jgi:hypothetical protein
MAGTTRIQVPPIWTSLMICAAGALWIDLGSLHRGHHADSLIPVLVSLQRWTPFFWEQNRYGMLIPWLARPVTHPLGNLLVQGFLNVFCGLSAFFLLARYMLADSSYPIVGAVGAVAFLTMAPAPYRFDYLMDANYGVWLALGLGGLIAARDAQEDGTGKGTWGRRLVALGLMVLAHWVYLASALYLGALVVFQALLGPADWRAVARDLRPASFATSDLAATGARVVRSWPVQALALIAAGFWAGMTLASGSPYQHTSYTAIPAGEWPHAWAELVVNTGRALAPGAWPWALGLGACLGLVACLASGRDGRRSIPWRGAAALVLAAVAVALFMGTRRWLKINVYVPRYLLPSVFLAQGALTMMFVVPACRALDDGRRRRLAMAVAPLMLLGAAIGYGPPSPGRVRAGLDRFGGLTADLLDARCTHLAGDYWTVWPAIFHAHLALAERGERRELWGVTFRGQPASVRWWHSPREGRIAAIPLHDTMGDHWLESFAMSRFRDVERRRTIRVLRWQKPSRDADQRP